VAGEMLADIGDIELSLLTSRILSWILVSFRQRAILP